MIRRALFPVLGLLLSASLTTSPAHGASLKDLYFGESLYYAHQGLWFEALERMDTCLLYTSPSPRDGLLSRMPSSA